MTSPAPARRDSILVTGCSSGFGDVIVRTLATAGHRVYATMRDVEGRNHAAAETLRRWAAEKQLDLSVLEMDVAEDASVAVAVTSILAAGGLIDVVVNNAGISASGPLEAFSSQQMQALLNVNAIGPLRVDQAVLPHLRQRRTGLLLHVSSTLGRILPGGGGLYPASKWALEGLVESLHYQVAPFGIDVVILEPGSFPTPALSRGLLPDNQAVAAEYAQAAPPAVRAAPGPDYRPPDIQEVADAVLRLIDMPLGTRPLRSIVGPIFTTGVEEFNQVYETYKQRLAESLKRPDQAITWGGQQRSLPSS